MLVNKSIDGLSTKDIDLLNKCIHCGHGRQRRSPHHPTKQKKKGIGFGTHVSADNTADQPVATYGGGKVINLVINEHTNWIWTKPLKSKIEPKCATVAKHSQRADRCDCRNSEICWKNYASNITHRSQELLVNRTGKQRRRSSQDIIRGVRTCL